jgi:hypothetical protein
MNISDSDLSNRRQAIINKYCELADFIEGSLFVRTVNGKERTYLSRMVNGVQRQLYISKKHFRKIQRGVEHWEELKQITHQLSEVNIQIIQQEQ